MAQLGMAYQLWALVESERVNQGWTHTEIAERIGLPRNTISRLRDSQNAPQARTVLKIADALKIDRDEAARLAGLLQPAREDRGVSVREAIQADPNYTEEQRATMLALVDIIDQANAAGGERGRRATG